MALLATFKEDIKKNEPPKQSNESLMFLLNSMYRPPKALNPTPTHRCTGVSRILPSKNKHKDNGIMDNLLLVEMYQYLKRRNDKLEATAL